MNKMTYGEKFYKEYNKMSKTEQENLLFYITGYARVSYEEMYKALLGYKTFLHKEV